MDTKEGFLRFFVPFRNGMTQFEMEEESAGRGGKRKFQVVLCSYQKWNTVLFYHPLGQNCNLLLFRDAFIFLPNEKTKLYFKKFEFPPNFRHCLQTKYQMLTC